MLIIREENIWETWPNYKKSSLIHDYVTLYVDRNAKPHDYGNGEFYSAIEMHILEKIYFNPGITVTEIAKTNKRKRCFTERFQVGKERAHHENSAGISWKAYFALANGQGKAADKTAYKIR